MTNRSLPVIDSEKLSTYLGELLYRRDVESLTRCMNRLAERSRAALMGGRTEAGCYSRHVLMAADAAEAAIHFIHTGRETYVEDMRFQLADLDRVGRDWDRFQVHNRTALWPGPAEVVSHA